MKLIEMKKLSFILVGLLILASGCRKDKEVITETIILGEDPAVYVNTSITGVVVDENDVPVRDALVINEQNAILTDDNGFFYLKDISANQNGAVLEVEKSGFHKTSQTVYPKLNSVEFVRIKILRLDDTGIIDAGNGGSVTIPGGAIVTLPPNGVTLNGTSYSNEVQVKAIYLDPTDEDLFAKMPGNLIGVRTDGRIQGMTTFGMIGVELFSNSGEKLQLADDARAEIKFPLSAEFIAEAPSTIALWHYDVESGYWMEEGEAQIEGQYYVAEVSHFSFWNCDAPFDLVTLKGRIIDQLGEPVVNVTVTLQRNAPTRNTGHATTRFNGTFEGKIPKDESLNLLVKDACGNVVHEEMIGPFGMSAQLGDIVVELSQGVKVTAKLVDCSSAPVEEGYLIIKVEESIVGYLTPDENGNIKGTVNVCSQGEISITAVDLSNGLKSDEQIHAYSRELNLGTIAACGNIIPTIHIVLPSHDVIIGEAVVWSYKDTANQDTVTTIEAEDSRGYFSIGIRGGKEGTFEVESISSMLSAPNMQFTDPRIEVTFTTYGRSAGEYVIGTFEGIVYDVIAGSDTNISGDFRALRK